LRREPSAGDTEKVNKPSHALALCALGLERIVASELGRIGLEVVERFPGRVRFSLVPPGSNEGSEALLMRANLCLRCAERVVIEAGRFPARDFDELFEGVRALPWELYFRREDRLVIERVRLRDSRLAAQTSVQSMVHKAVYERLGKVYGLSTLPETGSTRSLRVYVDSDDCLLGLDSSGEALHKRGYRRAAGEAPLKETVAAAALLLAGWSRRLPLLDPFCGSGTIGIEAALFAMDRAPGLGRAFALEDMPFARGGRASAEVEEAKARVRRDAEFRITCSDADPRALEAARANAARAGVAAGLEFSAARAEDLKPAFEAGCLLCNPPYGERLGSPAEAEALYRALGTASGRFSGWGLGFVTNRHDFGDFFGRYAISVSRITNGAEEQWFHWYPAGSEGREGKRPAAPVAAEHRGPAEAKRPAGRNPGRIGRPWVGPDKPGWKPR
jgi:putative N6-adenine-specific DNA methylase